MGDTWVPIGDVLGSGFSVAALPEGWTPLEGIVLVKCLDEDGRETWSFRHTEGLSDEEAIGALVVQLDMIREQVVDQFRAED